MKKTELSEICNVSRQMIYNCINLGLSEFEILKKYTKPLNGDYTISLNSKVEEQFVKAENNKKMIKDLMEVKRIVERMIIDYQKSSAKEINFIDINDIFEIVKNY